MSRTRPRRHAVAERLLVAEREPLDAADPLEAGQRLPVRPAGGRGERAEQRGGHDRVGVDALGPRAEQEVPEQRADLVAAQHPPAVRVGHRHRAPVRVRVVGDHDVRADLGGQRHRQVHGARLLRVGERDGREVRVGLGLRGRDVRRREPGPLHHPGHGLAADAVQRRVDDLQVPRAVRVDEGDDVREVGVDDVLAEPRPAVGPSYGVEGSDGVDRGGDLRVGGRHDLAAVAEVDLVAVVLGRVVRGGHHHAGDAAERPDGVGEHRRRQRAGEQHGLEARADHHRGGVLGEDVRAVPGVVPDHDGAAGVPLLDEVRREAGGCPDHHDPVHPVGAGADLPAQAGGAELEPPVEGVGELRGRTGPGRGVRPGLGGHLAEEVLELGAGVRVGVLGGPGAGAFEQLLGVTGLAHGANTSGRPARGARPGHTASGRPSRSRAVISLGRDRPGEQEALAQLAPEVAQQPELGGGLDALGDGLEVQALGHVHDRADDLLGVRAALELGHEAAVDLHHVGGEAVQVAQRGVAGAVVVDGHRDTAGPQVLHHRHGGLEVDGQRLLGELQDDLVRLDPVVGDQGEHPLGEPGLVELPDGDVDADREPMVGQVRAPAAELAAGLGHHVPAQHLDRAAVLRHRDEVGGGDRAELRVLPAQQRLDAADHAGAEVDDRLVDDRELLEHRLGDLLAEEDLLGGGVALGAVDHHDPALVAGLGLVERDVGVREQRVRRLDVAGGPGRPRRCWPAPGTGGRRPRSAGRSAR